MKLRSNDKKRIDLMVRKQIYNGMRPYFTGISDGYLHVITCKARKINKLFGYEYDSVILKKIKVNLKTILSNNKNVASASMLPDVNFDESEEEMNKVNNNFNNTSDVTDYFKLGNEFDSDINKSDSDIYFESDNSDFNDKYNYKLYEKLLYKEMVRKVKLENKIPAKPKVNDNKFQKILNEAFVDDHAFHSVTVST
ncbi:hypothetical protein RclHR1_01020026 [Rhizophagus clarus]|uniref:Uncharacterized protein n=1 Tax=Rhizophagus clarus TaxID=94130 RepID=A0A2Z6Q206_9GLOM|nr:hypothetical protein RclHR1_01020026 [Rhizophagus clarus]GES76520.1 hypothetical protein GLOIN_2v1806926 [Rhizophagus clarus]